MHIERNRFQFGIAFLASLLHFPKASEDLADKTKARRNRFNPQREGGRLMLKMLRKKSKGFTLIELLIVVAIIGILAAIAIPNLLSAQRRARYSRAASDTKTATTQGIVYANDRNQNPVTLTNLRMEGYANVQDNDPWSNPYELSQAYASNSMPAAPGDMWVCSEGANTTGDCPAAGASWAGSEDAGVGGPVGYSSTYGSWQGR